MTKEPLTAPTPAGKGRVVRVVVDVPALADQRRELDYLVPDGLNPEVAVGLNPALGVGLNPELAVGALVRVPLHGRRVAGWVVADQVEPRPSVHLQPVSRVSSVGPAPDVVDLTAWASWRWAGRRTAFLRAASPPTNVRTIPRPDPARSAVRRAGPGAPSEVAAMAADALVAGEAVVRLPPAADPLPLLLAAAPSLVACPSVEQARELGRRLHAAGAPVAVLPEGWARAAGGQMTVIGARAAVWGPMTASRAIVVLDAHDQALVEERAPTWSAWVVAAERARRAGIPCVLVSPCPTIEQQRWGRLILPSRSVERAGWAVVEIADRTAEDPRQGLLGDRLVPHLRRATPDMRVVCILNRKGRIRLLSCRTCGRLTTCEHCGGAMQQAQPDADLSCRRCGRARPKVCQSCGSAALRTARAGVAKVRDDLEALAQLPVGEITAETKGVPNTPILVGTDAALYRLRERVGTVAFLDFDAELLAPRYRAGEDALASLAAAARLVGGRVAAQGKVIVQTRLPGHAVLTSAVRADPGIHATQEIGLRAELRLPPFSALAELSGDPETTAATAARLEAQLGVEVVGPTGGKWLVRATDHRVLCDALATAGRPTRADGVTLRIDVDPVRV